MLALTSELGTRPDVETHVCSFPHLKKRVESIRSRLSSPVIFHPLKGRTWMEVVIGLASGPEGMIHPPSSKSDECFRTVDRAMAPWEPEEYPEIVDGCKAVIEEINPDVILVDILFSPATDACRTLNRRYIINSPVQVCRSASCCFIIQPRYGYWTL